MGAIFASLKLREQILAALRELLSGFERADRVTECAILRDMRGEYLQEMYTGLVTVLMRMVFVLYAEERGLLPMESDLYANTYSLTRLHTQLQEDDHGHGEPMNDRYGAWGRVITLFRVLHDGVSGADGMLLPARKGSFFDPDAFPFLEGRRRGSIRQTGEVLELPRISDSVVFRLLDRMLVVDGERLQYEGLDVEQIGSVYEGLMGFELEMAERDSLCLLPEHVVVDLEALLQMSGAERLKSLKARANFDVKDKSAGAVKGAKTVEALAGALGKRVSPRQPGILARGSLYLQPGEERRRTGSHYTPRSLTQPLVETTLRPVLERLGANVRPEELLALEVCDPAMGSGAFLVEAIRQLADKLVDSWRRTKTMPDLPRNGDPVLHARRLIAQKCIYGVDKNPLAVDLARLSIWLETFAKEHPFTFVDHSLRHGDSLVGLSKEQILHLSLDAASGAKLAPQARSEAEMLRAQKIVDLGDPPVNNELRDLWDRANWALRTMRMLGDLVVASFFRETNDKARKKLLEDTREKIAAWSNNGSYERELHGMVAELREGPRAVPAFHWDIEFPEVFGRDNPGFDCLIGNPPFLGGTLISKQFGMVYFEYLTTHFPPAQHLCDLIAYFFRRSFSFLRVGGTLGLVATKTVARGDTRSGGLRQIVGSGGVIYEATVRYRWPGDAAVLVSIVNVIRGQYAGPVYLNGQRVEQINSFLFHVGGNEAPAKLARRNDLFSIGTKIYGAGFLFEDGNRKASSLEDMHRLLAVAPHAQKRIFPYIGGDELNSSPNHCHNRYVINLNDIHDERGLEDWPELAQIVREKVKPDRDKLGDNPNNIPLRQRWWAYQGHRPQLYAKIKNMRRVLACSRHQPHWCIAFLPTNMIFSDALMVFTFDSWQAISLLQSHPHENWVRFFGSSMKDDLRYTASDCFETFPFPADWEYNEKLESIGKTYYEFRAALMIKNNEGLTKTYNRFHDPDEPSDDIKKLRDLHAQMDRAVLDTYGWTELAPCYDFRLQLDESIRYTWGDGTRDEVLARLWELNQLMAAEDAEEAKKSATQRGR